MGNGKSSSFQKLITSQEGGVTKLFKTPITFNNDKVETTKRPRKTKSYNLISTFLCPLSLWQCQIHPRYLWIVVQNIERVITSADCEI